MKVEGMITSTMAASPIQIASNVIEKLQEENRISLEALHKTQNEIKYLQKQLLEKDQIIKILEERLRRGSNTYLEVNNRQKEITIKHLELQIERLLKENQELDLQINSVKADICRKCENKLLCVGDRKAVSKPLVKKNAKDLPVKSSTNHQINDNMLQRIIEHKDKRIEHLSKEIHKLTQTEKKLTEKIYRLTKLLPMSQMPSEMLIECLLSEIKSLETQIQLHKGIGEINASKPKLSVKGISIHPTSYHSPQSAKVSSPKKNYRNEQHDFESDGSMLVVSKLHKLFNDVSELRQFFAFENEKMHQNLSKNCIRQEALKVQWKDIIRKLNDISECIECILRSNSNNASSDEKERLQDMLKNSLELNSQYEEENASLKADLERLNERLAQEQKRLEGAERRVRQCSEEFSKLEGDFRNDVHEVQLLKAQLKDKQRQLDFTEKHLETCQTLIQELQKLPKESELLTKRVAFDLPDNSRQIKSLERKLDVAEKNIKSCEEVIEELQKVIRNLEEENSKLDSDLHLAKLNKVVSDANATHYVSLKTKLDETEDKLITVTSNNQDLQSKLDLLEEKNAKLQTDLNTCNNTLSRGNFEEKNTLRVKLDMAERTIRLLENNLVQLQTSVERLKEENSQMRLNIRSSKNEKNLAEAYEDDVSFLRNEAFLKDEEIKRLKESLETFERKVFEINLYRKALRQEISKLCDALTGNGEDKSSPNWQAIYNAAILRSAQAILRLDDDCPPRTDENNNDALEEMKHQVSVYLMEVARIHELLTLKTQQREEMIRQYLTETCVSGATSREFFVTEDPPNAEVESHSVPKTGNEDVVAEHPSKKQSGLQSPDTLPGHWDSPCKSRSQSTSMMDRAVSPLFGPGFGSNRTLRTSNKAVNTSPSPVVHTPPSTVTLESEVRLEGQRDTNARVEELEVSKNATSYFLSKCSELEQLLSQERAELERTRREANARSAELEEMRRRLRVEEETRVRMREEEISAEQLRSEVRWLAEENRRTLERVARTQAELRRCEEENARVQSDLDELRQQLINERYEHAKVNNQLRHLRVQLADSRVT